MASLPASPLPPVRKDTYEAISPSRPNLSQAGKTILVTGGGYGVGYAIAKSFAQASASAIILVGRRESILQSATEKLKAISADINPNLKVYVHTVDVTDHGSTTRLWNWLVDEGLVIDVLILNAGRQSPFKTLLELGLQEVWNFYQVNVYGHMDFAEHFYKQDRRGSNVTPILINVSTAGIWDFVSCQPVPVYPLTKSSGTMLLQQIAQDVPSDVMRIINYHPGLIVTEATKDIFPDPTAVPWVTAELGGDFAVWLASPDAAFLHGRYVEATWDVDDILSDKFRKRLDNDTFLLKVGVLGFHP